MTGFFIVCRGLDQTTSAVILEGDWLIVAIIGNVPPFRGDETGIVLRRYAETLWVRMLGRNIRIENKYMWPGTLAYYITSKSHHSVQFRDIWNTSHDRGDHSALGAKSANSSSDGS